MDDLNFFNQKKKKKKTKKIFDIDEAEEGVKVCLQNLTMAENSLASIFLRLAVQELSQVCHCVLVQFITKLYISFLVFLMNMLPGLFVQKWKNLPALHKEQIIHQSVGRAD